MTLGSKRIWWLLPTLLWSATVSATAPVALRSVVPAGASKVARPRLVEFSRQVREEEAKRLGFGGRKQASRAVLGIPLRDYFVRLDQLKTYGPQIKPETLFQRSPEVVYPILVGSRTVSSMTLAEHDDAFTVATLGSSGLVVALAATREAVAKAQNVPQRAFFIVRVPALGLVYLGHEMPDGFYLTTVNPRVANSPGVSSERAEVVLQRLVPLAQGLRDDAPS